MKQLTCEMCGGTDLIKQDGVFVCQSCGCKYSVEEAKKMMIEGTVDVSGSTIKIDKTQEKNNYLINARRAKDKEDWEETEKYYNLVEQYEPNNIEAIFYSAYAKACNTLTEADFYKKQSAFGVLKNCVEIIDDNYNESEKEIVQKIAQDILGLYNINFVYNQKKNGYGVVVEDDSAKTINLFHHVGAEFVQSCLNIAETYPIDDKNNRCYFYRIASAVADISCNHDYKIKIKKLAFPDSTDELKPITFVNNYSGLGSMNIFVTVVGEFVRRQIPKGTTTIEFAPGNYEIIMYAGFGNDSSTAAKGKTSTFIVPENSTIEIAYKFLKNGYYFEIS